MLTNKRGMMTAVLITSTWLAGADAQGASIHDVRTDSGTYPDGTIIDEVTGVVVLDMDHMNYHMGRFHLQDANGGLYSGIAVVDNGGSSGDLVRAVKVGDRVTLHNALFGDRAAFGNDVLYYDAISFGSSFDAPVPGTLPDYTVVAAADVPGGPLSGSGAEQYQSMRLLVEDVTITGMGLGKAGDDYSLIDAGGDTLWAADYVNEDKQYSGIWWNTTYHHYVSPDDPSDPHYDPNNPINDDGYGGIGQEFLSISGVLESYRNDPVNPTYDYYQLLTLDDASFGLVPVPEPSTMVLFLLGIALIGVRRGSRGRPH